MKTHENQRFYKILYRIKLDSFKLILLTFCRYESKQKNRPSNHLSTQLSSGYTITSSTFSFVK